MTLRRNYPRLPQDSETEGLLNSTEHTAPATHSNGKRSFFIDRVVNPLISRSRRIVRGGGSEYMEQVDERDARGRSRSISMVAAHLPTQGNASNSSTKSGSYSTYSGACTGGRHSPTEHPSVSNPWAVSAHTFTVRREHDYTISCTVIQPADAPHAQVGTHAYVQEMLSSLPSTNAHGSGGDSVGRKLRKVPPHVGLNLLAKSHSDKARLEKQRPPLPNDRPGWGPASSGDASYPFSGTRPGYDGYGASTRMAGPMFGPEARRAELEKRFADTDREAKLIAKGRGPLSVDIHGHGRVPVPSSSSQTLQRHATQVHVSVDVNVRKDSEVVTDEELRRRTQERARDQAWRREWHA